MSRLPNTPEFLERVFHYAKKTGIKFISADFDYRWKFLGLPDVRGFTPHLREVRLSRYWPEDETGFWIVHDLLHILFYDFATLNLGVESWSLHERFIENHLASELFAVLALDYHYLSKTDIGGLAVDLNLRKSSASAGRSFQFCEKLKELYLEGNKEAVADGHEIRYAEKQRFYTLAWWEDLLQLRLSHQQAVVEASQVHYALWELIDLFFYAPKVRFKSFLKEAAAMNSKNVFGDLPKYQNHSMEVVDYRFTGIKSQKLESCLKALDGAKTPSGSNLFLFWQVIGSFDVDFFSPQDQHAIFTLAQESQTPESQLQASKAWTTAHNIACTAGARLRPWATKILDRSVFFLP